MARIEKDALGEKKVPSAAYYGISTARSLENFKISGEPMPMEIINAIATLKLACAKANVAMGTLSKKKGTAIERACKNILDGKYTDQFNIDVFQSGSGTSSNMNVNEVVANLSTEMLGGKRGDRSVHPNDDVNKGQSTNNIIPSAIRIATYDLAAVLITEATSLAKEFRTKENTFKNILKTGRTHLQDAVPMTLGQGFGAYATALEKATSRIERSRQMLLELGVGGTAIGTGMNTKPAFRKEIIKELNTLTKQKYVVARNGVEATQFLTDFADLSCSLRLLSLDLLKITNDLRLLSSGPNTGLGEISLPAVEPGSSIMPGKINPSICEATNMACMQVLGFDHTISLAVGAGQLELNTHMPLVGLNLVRSFQILTATCSTLRKKCVRGITANKEICLQNFEKSAGLATILNPLLGYDRVSELVKESLRTKTPLKTLVLKKKLLSEKEFDRIAMNATQPT